MDKDEDDNNNRDQYYSAGPQYAARKWTSELCRDICDLDDNILNVALIEDGDLSAIHSKKCNIPTSIPSQKSFGSIFFQLSLIADLYSCKEELYGTLESFTARFRNGDILCFAIDRKKYYYPRNDDNKNKKKINSVIAIWLDPNYYYCCHEDRVITILRRFLQERFLDIP
jgi:hypothetical protein